MTRHIIWQTALALLGIALIFIILFQQTEIEPEEAPPVVTERVAAAGGAYIEGVLGYSEAINPILSPRLVSANPVDQDLTALVFEGLTALDATGQITPALATDWQVSEDGNVYEFHLRPGVTWHDGAPLTAADVAFTIQAMQDPNYQGDPNLADLWHGVTVEQVDALTVRLVLAEPFPSLLYYTTIGLLPAHLLSDVPPADLPRHSFSTRQPVGTGRFMVQSKSEDQVVLIANPNYWGAKPYLDRVEFWFYGDWEGLLEDYKAGIIQGFHPPDIEQQRKLARFPNLQLYSAPLAGYGIVYLNLQSETAPFFQSKEVRQGMLYALDRQSLIDSSLDGQGLVADSPIPSFIWAYDPTVRRYGYDPERAIGLLDASGWLDSNDNRIRDKDGVEISFTLLVNDEPAMRQMAEEMAQQWSQVGIEARLRPLSSGALAALVRNRNFDAALVEIGLSADPDPYPLWHSTQAEEGQNFGGFANDEADVVMEEARFTTDPEQRLKLYHTFQQIFAEEAPALLIYYPIYTYAVDAQVQGVQIAPLLHPGDRFRNIAQWYVQTREVTINGED